MHCIPVTRAPVRPYKAARVIVHPPYNTPAVRTDPVVRERPAHPPTPSLPPFCWSCFRPSGFARPCLFRSHHRTVFATKSQFSTLILYSFCRSDQIGTSVSIKMLSIYFKTVQPSPSALFVVVRFGPCGSFLSHECTPLHCPALGSCQSVHQSSNI